MWVFKVILEIPWLIKTFSFTNAMKIKTMITENPPYCSKSILIIILLLASFTKNSTGQMLTLDPIKASELAQIPLNCLQKKYPNKLNQVLGSDEDLLPPEELHPAFFGCFDWHSSVHGHWMLVKLLKLYPELQDTQKIRDLINDNLTSDHIQKEIDYFTGEHNKTFERTYGWAWLLKLAGELYGWNDQDGKSWYNHLKPLADLLVNNFQNFLPKLTYPIRTGEHPNTAFGLSLAYDYAQLTENQELVQLIVDRSMYFYFEDKGCPMNWEPNGFDFLSPCLEEANLMRKILSKEKFALWIEKFFDSSYLTDFILQPAFVSDRSDPKIVHLDGLNFSRAWCLYGISNQLEAEEKKHFKKLGDIHLKTSFPFISSGNYEGEHWLASFALLALTSSPEFKQH